MNDEGCGVEYVSVIDVSHVGGISDSEELVEEYCVEIRDASDFDLAFFGALEVVDDDEEYAVGADEESEWRQEYLHW